jgi:hypothetical protein
MRTDTEEETAATRFPRKAGRIVSRTWEYDDIQFGGHFPPINSGASGKPDLLAAIQQQLGLRLESLRKH